jgi:hypothetical protein
MASPTHLTTMASRFTQLYALAADPNEDAAECARADLFHETNYDYRDDSGQSRLSMPRNIQAPRESPRHGRRSLDRIPTLSGSRMG